MAARYRYLSLSLLCVTEATVRQYMWKGQSVIVTEQLWSYVYLQYYILEGFVELSLSQPILVDTICIYHVSLKNWLWQ